MNEDEKKEMKMQVQKELMSAFMHFIAGKTEDKRINTFDCLMATSENIDVIIRSNVETLLNSDNFEEIYPLAKTLQDCSKELAEKWKEITKENGD